MVALHMACMPAQPDHFQHDGSSWIHGEFICQLLLVCCPVLPDVNSLMESQRHHIDTSLTLRLDYQIQSSAWLWILASIACLKVQLLCDAGSKGMGRPNSNALLFCLSAGHLMHFSFSCHPHSTGLIHICDAETRKQEFVPAEVRSRMRCY